MHFPRPGAFFPIDIFRSYLPMPWSRGLWRLGGVRAETPRLARPDRLVMIPGCLDFGGRPAF